MGFVRIDLEREIRWKDRGFDEGWVEEGEEGLGRTHSGEKYQTRIQYEESTDFRGSAENGGG